MINLESHRTLARTFADAPSSFWGCGETVFAKLVGLWSLTRRIAGIARMQGEARISLIEGDTLHYFEQGCLSLNDGQRFTASRSYLFRARPQGFAVHFDQPTKGLFQEVSLTANSGGILAATAMHLCPPDRYASRYNFLPNGSFVIAHRVKGPRKDFCLVSRYRQAGRW